MYNQVFDAGLPRSLLAFILLLLPAGWTFAEGQFVVKNRTDNRVSVWVTRSHGPKKWANVDIKPGAEGMIRLVSQDTFDVRIFLYGDGRVTEELGVNGINLHEISDTPGGTFYLRLLHWRTWIGTDQYIDHPTHPVHSTCKIHGEGGVATLEIGASGGIGSKDHDPPRPPRVPAKPKKKGDGNGQ